MEAKNWHKLPVLFCLYIAQSIPMSFFSTVVPVIMRQGNYSLQSIGLLQLVKLPWILKFLWAPVVDNHTRSLGQLRRWIVVSELFYAIVILGIGFFNLQTDFKLIIVLMVIAFIASATQDIAVDIYAILMLKPAERSIGNSIQSAGTFVGSILGTGVLLIAYHYFGWSYLLLLLAAFVLIAIVPLACYRQPLPNSCAVVKRITFTDIFRFFALKGMYKWVLVLVFYYSGIIGILAMVKPYLVDLGYNIKQIGLLSGILGTSAAAISAFAAGFIVKRIGRKCSLYSFLTVSLMAGLLFWFISGGTPSMAMIYSAVILLWCSYGLSTVIVYTIAMDKVRQGSEGTDFTMQIVITHLSGLIFAVISGKLADSFGYHTFFGIEALFSLLALSILYFTLKDHHHGNQ